MPDPYATIAKQDAQVQEMLANAMDVRGGEERQVAMMAEYLRRLELPREARLLDVGCGTGVMTRHLADLLQVREVVGIDPSPVLLERARANHAQRKDLRFEQGDGRELPYEDAAFDAVVFHTVLCHVPGCEDALAEAQRVLKPGGWMAVFDGDYATTTVAAADHDPLEACAKAAIAGLVHDHWLVRRLPSLLMSAGLEVVGSESHGYVQMEADGYMRSIVNRGADLLVAQGAIGEALAEALKVECDRRAAVGRFFGHIAYGSVIARRPA